MSNLFIIGNGFDLSHKLKTSYHNFHSFLKDSFPESTDEYTLPQIQLYPEGSLKCDETDTVSFIRYAISNIEDDKWSNLESSLASLDFKEYFHESDDFVNSKEDDLFKKAYENEDIGSDISICMEELQYLFNNWINTISTKNINPKLDFKNLITKNSKFLTFNYTNTLEDVYNVKNICHIHGKQGEPLFFGHGSSNCDNSSIIGADYYLDNIFHSLKKNTELALENNINFFNSLDTSIKNIYSFGFSFGDVDLVYIKKICDILPTENITWFFNDYDEKSIPFFKKQIKNCGFKGKFELFTINS